MNTKRMERANSYHDRGFNCSQSVLAAFTDVTGLSEEEIRDAVRISGQKIEEIEDPTQS